MEALRTRYILALIPLLGISTVAQGQQMSPAPDPVVVARNAAISSINAAAYAMDLLQRAVEAQLRQKDALIATEQAQVKKLTDELQQARKK